MDPILSPGHQRTRAALQAPRCQHIRLNGQRCAAPALRGQEHCHFHDSARHAAHTISSDLPFIEDATSLQFVLMDVIRTLATGHADYKYCALMLYALQIAGANLKNLRAELPQATEVEAAKMAGKHGDQSSRPELLLGPAKSRTP